jgi:hypothetical protein
MAFVASPHAPAQIVRQAPLALEAHGRCHSTRRAVAAHDRGIDGARNSLVRRRVRTRWRRIGPRAPPERFAAAAQRHLANATVRTVVAIRAFASRAERSEVVDVAGPIRRTRRAQRRRLRLVVWAARGRRRRRNTVAGRSARACDAERGRNDREHAERAPSASHFATRLARRVPACANAMHGNSEHPRKSARPKAAHIAIDLSEGIHRTPARCFSLRANIA